MRNLLDEAFDAVSGSSRKQKPEYQTKIFQLRDIPGVMRSKLGWPVAASLMERWFNGAPLALPLDVKRSAEGNRLSQLPPALIDETIVTMAWALKFSRVKAAVAHLQANWASPAGIGLLKRRIVRELPQRIGQCWRFGNLNQPAKVLDDLSQVNFVGVGKTSDPMDDFYGAMGESQLKLAVSGIVISSSGVTSVEIDELGFYLRDAYDFNDSSFISQPLGCWGFNGVECGISTRLSIEIEDTIADINPKDAANLKYYVKNSDFQKWRNKNNKGGDFMVVSDVHRVRLAIPQKFTI
ncbi:hypothetical protein SAMN04489708_1294 [Paracidovorax cattleyae]|uniref:Uncharacterized protein n=2 Tax=Paracidovorax cattleyae TaxID=80868 RepID=A0A1H0VUC2_9BURK|nr:DUF6402 family protein [Paracidovorax cattleyae]AVS75226.1 hypothetical protein C8240_15660 [Paracidovorax cattleyae]MBF9263643.1 hypothetical protein [Paracidovorax cattleyae]SDP82182.1 hypothetical protein SAMN04489708_1294 [Paracidovorax cattleyae]